MSHSFNQAEVFPLIARLITQAYTRDQSFIDHRQIVAMLIADTDGKAVVDRAVVESSLRDAMHVASNMVAWFSQRITVANSPWASFFERERQPDGWAYRPIMSAQSSIITESDLVAIEGDPRMYFHLRRERDPAISQAKRHAVMVTHGKLSCESCGFWTQDSFPGLDAELCEIHHRLPLAFASEPVKTSLNDLAVLCPNCHRAIHRTMPLMSVEEFRSHFFIAADKAAIG